MNLLRMNADSASTLLDIIRYDYVAKCNCKRLNLYSLSCLELIDKQPLSQLHANSKELILHTIEDNANDNTEDHNDCIQKPGKVLGNISIKETEKAAVDSRTIVSDWNLFGMGDNELIYTKTDNTNENDNRNLSYRPLDQNSQQSSHSIPHEAENSWSRNQKEEISSIAPPCTPDKQLLMLEEQDEEESQQDDVNFSLTPPQHRKDKRDFMFDMSLLQYD